MNARPALRVANCSGFYGDRLAAAREMVDGGPVDVLTGDWLAELTMGILARQRAKHPEAGYARTFVTQLEDVLDDCLERGIKIVSNAGGLNPAGCAAQVEAIAARLGREVKVAVVTGDDATAAFRAAREHGWEAPHLDTGSPIGDAEPLLANAYLGGWAIAEALAAGADVVVTGRVTDAALTMGPAAWHFGWSRDDWDRLAGAVVAGHVIECGAQATGGNFSFFTELANARGPAPAPGLSATASSGGSVSSGSTALPGGSVMAGAKTAPAITDISGMSRLARQRFPDQQRSPDQQRLPDQPAPTDLPAPTYRPGFPLAEIYADGSSVITKHPGTGGAVTVDTVTAQLLYEVDGPRYLGPDVITRLDTVRLEQDGPDRVRISGVRGEPPPETVKVGALIPGGWRNEGTFILTGLDIEEKARLAQAALWAHVPGGEKAFGRVTVRLLRADRPDPPTMHEAVALLTITVTGQDPKLVAGFSRAAVETGLASYPGLHMTAPPGPGSPVIVFWPTLLPAKDFTQTLTLDGRSRDVPLTASATLAPSTATATATGTGTATPAAATASTSDSATPATPGSATPSRSTGSAPSFPATSTDSPSPSSSSAPPAPSASDFPPSSIASAASPSLSPRDASPSPSASSSPPRSSVRTFTLRQEISPVGVYVRDVEARSARHLEAPSAPAPAPPATSPASATATTGSGATSSHSTGSAPSFPATSTDSPFPSSSTAPPARSASASPPSSTASAPSTPTESTTPYSSIASAASPSLSPGDASSSPAAMAKARVGAESGGVSEDPFRRQMGDPADEGHRGDQGTVVRAALGSVLGARSGDKAGNATLGVWARDEAGHRWLRSWWTERRLRELLPEAAGLELRLWELPLLRACGVTVVGLLGAGVAANHALDGQAKALGEYFRAKVADIPAELLPD